MEVKNKFDDYIKEAKPFARPILKHIRYLVHLACPEVQEVMKWSSPHFDYKGMMCGMAAFKEHCVLGFWKGAIMKDPYGIMDINRETSMGHFGRICSLEDLPPDDVILEYIKEAMALNDQGIKLPRKPAQPKQELIVPEDLLEALMKEPKAQATFDNFSYSKRKDYIEWITEAKQETTRQKRLLTAIEWMSEGKSRHWKYESSK